MYTPLAGRTGGHLRRRDTVIFELTMGQNHVYFPDEEKWMASVPHWAKDKRPLFLDACKAWCSRNNIPFSVTENALVYAEKRN